MTGALATEPRVVEANRPVSAHPNLHGPANLPRPPELDSESTRYAADKLDELPINELPKLARNLRTAGHGNKELLTAIADCCCRRINEFKSTDSEPEKEKGLITVAWELGAARIPHEKFFETLKNLVQADVSVFKSKWLVNLTISLRHAGLMDPDFQRFVAREIAARPEPETKRAKDRISEELQTYDRLEERLERLRLRFERNRLREARSNDQQQPREVTLAAGKLLASIGGMTATEVSNVAKDFAALGVRNHQQLETLERQILKRDTFRARELVRLTACFEHNPKLYYRVFDKIQDNCVALIDRSEISMRDFTSTLGGISHIHRAKDLYIGRAAHFITEKAPVLPADLFVSCATAMARQRFLTDSCEQAIKTRISAGKDLFLPSQQVQLTWACGVLGIPCDRLLADSLERFDEFKSVLSTGNLSKLAWSAAAHCSPSGNTLCSQIIRAQERSGWNVHPIEVIQCFQAVFSTGIEIPPGLAQRMREIEAELRLIPPPQNSLELKVAQLLKDQGHQPKMQVPAAGYYIDLVVEHTGRKIAVECDGTYYHYVRGLSVARSVGSDAVKNRCLQRLGFHIVRVSDREIESIDLSLEPNGSPSLVERLLDAA